ERVGGLQKAAVLRASLGGRQAEANAVRENKQAEIILKRLADMGQHENRVDGVIELAEIAHACGHHAADVEAKDDVLAVLALKNGGDRLAAAGGCHPVDVPIVIIDRVV